MNTVTTHWQTSLAGVAAGLLLMATQLYKPGMTFKQWVTAIATSGTVALVGILASDGSKTPAQ